MTNRGILANFASVEEVSAAMRTEIARRDVLDGKTIEQLVDAFYSSVDAQYREAVASGVAELEDVAEVWKMAYNLKWDIHYKVRAGNNVKEESDRW